MLVITSVEIFFRKKLKTTASLLVDIVYCLGPDNKALLIKPMKRLKRQAYSLECENIHLPWSEEWYISDIQ